MAVLNAQQIEQHLKALLRQFKSGNHTGMLAKTSKLVKIAPRDARVQDFYGVVNASLARHKECVEAHAKAVELAPKRLEFRYRYAQALQRAGRYEDAMLEFERINYQDKDNFRALRGRISALTDLGRLEDAYKAIKYLEKTLRKGRPTPNVELSMAISLIRLCPDVVTPEEVLPQIEPLADNEQCDDHLRISAYFQMGRVYEKIKRHDDAFRCWAKTKSLKHLEWDPDEYSRRIDRLVDCWSEDCDIPQADSDGSRMIYVLGMMRSGTSLTEQMLAQIPAITPGGEMNAVSRRVSEVEREKRTKFYRPLPFSRQLYTREVINRMTRDAWEMYNEVSPSTSITDKQPFNCYFVPLIARMFPGCKIIHCMRDPQDCCLSNYMQNFSRPHPQTNDLYWLGRYFKDYERMMHAWRELSLPNMLDLQYEELVADPEAQSKRVMEFLGFDWTEDILNFHKSSRTVRTASREQVRKPIYKSSVKKHELYTEHLGELRRGLGIEQD